MNRCYKRILSALLVATIILASVPNMVRAADVDYDMDYSSGGGGGTTGSGTGYSVNDIGDAKACGYRFTVVASTGKLPVCSRWVPFCPTENKFSEKHLLNRLKVCYNI